MGTDFSCPIMVSALPADGTVALSFGPLQPGRLAGLLDWLATDEARAYIIDYAADALLGVDCERNY